MSFDPYDILGVERTATRVEIKAAYRKLARTLHPDAGGGAEAFARLAEANAILSDPTRREIYDRTGKTDQERMELDARNFVANLLNAAIEQIQGDVDTIDVLAEMKNALKAELSGVVKAIKTADAKIARTRKMAKRFKAKKEGDNFFRRVLDQRVADFEKERAMHETQRSVRQFALVIIDGYVYERKEPQQMRFFMSNQAFTSSSETNNPNAW
jgi:curved DNA-binding protein CbpA